MSNVSDHQLKNINYADNPWLSLLGEGREWVVIDMWKGEEYTGCLSHKLTNFAKMRR